MKNTVLLCAVFALAEAALLSLPSTKAFSQATPQALSDDCVSVEVRQFYPGQSGSQMYYLTDNCGKTINVDFATQGMQTQYLQLQNGEGHFTGWVGHVPAPYKFWYCPAPWFPIDPNGAVNGPVIPKPLYEADKVACGR